MKIKYDGTGIELTDKDSKNLINFIEYWITLPEKDKVKLKQLILECMGAATYISIIYLLVRRREK